MKQAGSQEIAWRIDREGDNLSSQIAMQLRQAIDRGELRPGDRLPPSRRLAVELRLARGTVTNAIEQLLAEGLLEARVGSGTYVSQAASWSNSSFSEQAISSPAMLHDPPDADIDPPVSVQTDLRPCRPSLELFPMTVWRRCVADAASAIPSSDYGDPCGDVLVRQEISDYLRRARGMVADPYQIIITNGAVHAMHLLARLYLDDSRVAAVENPGYPLARQVLASTGALIRYCPVDEDGLVTDALVYGGLPLKVIYTSPSHQFPIGSRLSLTRRRELVGIAEKCDALIIEDDYDGEFRYDVLPLPPMYTMAPERVVYCGTFSKTLFPGLRIGFAVAPREVIEAMAALRAVSEYAPSETLQRALARFIGDGEYERHILRMRRLYATKRKRVTEGLESCRARATGLESGLSALIEIDPSTSAGMVSSSLLAQGIAVPALSRYDFTGDDQRNALVLGYAEPPQAKLERAVEAIARAVG